MAAIDSKISILDLKRDLNRIQSNVVLEGGFATINAGDNTKIDITAIKALHIDAYTDPVKPVRTFIQTDAFTGVSITNINNAPLTYIWLKQDGTLLQTLTDPITFDQYRDYILIAAVIHVDFATIGSINNVKLVPQINIIDSLSDIQNLIGPLNQPGGNLYSPNGANLKMDKNAGYLFFLGSNWHDNRKNPNLRLLAAESPVTFDITWRDGAGGWNFNRSDTIIPGVYDDGTGGATQPNGTVLPFSWQTYRIHLTSASGTVLQYGQKTYANIAAAIDGITLDSYFINPALKSVSHRGYLIVRGNAADLSLVGDASFINRGILGETIESGVQK